MEKKAQTGDSIDVAYVAHLARMHLSEEERARFQGQLQQIVEFVKKIQALDVTGIEPTSHARVRTNVFRADEVQPDLDSETAMRNAPAQTNGQFLVPKIVE